MLVRQSAIYLIGRLVPAALAFGLVALYTRLLDDPADYGQYAFVVLNATTAFALTAMWLSTAAIRLYPREGGREPYLWGLAVGFLAVLAITGAGLAVLLVVLDSGEARRLALLGFLLFALTAWFELNADMLTTRLKAGAYVVHNIVRTVLGGALGGALAWAGWGAEGILLGTILGLAVPALWLTREQWRDVSFARAHPETLRGMLVFGVPLSLSYAVNALVFATDRYVISALEGAAMLGLYAVGFEIADRIVKAISASLGTAALPLLIERYEREGVAAARRQGADNLLLLAGLSVPAALGLIAVTPELVTIVVGETYRAMAIDIVPIIALAALLAGLRGHYFDHAFHVGLQTRRHVWVVATMAAVNLGLSVVLVRIMGPVGAAYGTLGAYAVGLLASIVLGRRAFALPLLPGALARIAAAGLVMLAATHAIHVSDPGLSLVLKVVAGVLVYGALVYALDVGHLRRRLDDWRRRTLPPPGALPEEVWRP